jgi:hypothetical protein
MQMKTLPKPLKDQLPHWSRQERIELMTKLRIARENHKRYLKLFTQGIVPGTRLEYPL